jgi:hypothetical protein
MAARVGPPSRWGPYTSGTVAGSLDGVGVVGVESSSVPLEPPDEPPEPF